MKKLCTFQNGKVVVMEIYKLCKYGMRERGTELQETIE